MKKDQFKDLRERKFLLLRPLLLIPFFTVAFWALGGGEGKINSKGKRAARLSLRLPNVQLNRDKNVNKLSFYEEAQKKSVEWEAGRPNDLSYRGCLDTLVEQRPGHKLFSIQSDAYNDSSRQKIYQKLAELNRAREIGDSRAPSRQKARPKSSVANQSAVGSTGSNPLEETIRQSNKPPSKDPEIQQLSNMMDRILDIQHPDRIKENENETARGKEKVYPVETKTAQFTISLLDSSMIGERTKAFEGLDVKSADSARHTIEAVIHQQQSVVEGSIVKMRLLDDVIISGELIRRGSFVFGNASLNGERLHIDISSLRKGNTLYPVKLMVYDLDGMEGIHIPGVLTRDVARETADRSLQEIGLSSLDRSLKAQAAAAGIHAGKSLLSKKAKLEKVTLKAGYKILLKEKTNP